MRAVGDRTAAGQLKFDSRNVFLLACLLDIDECHPLLRPIFKTLTIKGNWCEFEANFTFCGLALLRASSSITIQYLTRLPYFLELGQ